MQLHCGAALTAEQRCDDGSQHRTPVPLGHHQTRMVWLSGVCTTAQNRLRVCTWANEQGEQPHCGFPEVQYLRHAERLVRQGLRVVVVEQTETPDMLRARNDARPPGQAKARTHPEFKTLHHALCCALSLGRPRRACIHKGRI